jgi:hypothetical protein
MDAALDGGEWSASRPDCFTPRERAPPYPLDRKQVGPHSRSGSYGEEKIFFPLPEIETPAVQPVTHRHSY